MDVLYFLLMAIYLMVAANGRAENGRMKYILTGLSIAMFGIAMSSLAK